MINYTPGRKKGAGRKILIICICVFAVVFLSISAVGLIAGYDGEKRQGISDAISENEQLKQEVSKQKAEIEKLKEQNEELEDELENRPSASPTPFELSEKSSEEKSSQKKASPRDDESAENSDG